MHAHTAKDGDRILSSAVAHLNTRECSAVSISLPSSPFRHFHRSANTSDDITIGGVAPASASANNDDTTNTALSAISKETESIQERIGIHSPKVSQQHHHHQEDVSSLENTKAISSSVSSSSSSSSGRHGDDADEDEDHTVADDVTMYAVMDLELDGSPPKTAVIPSNTTIPVR